MKKNIAIIDLGTNTFNLLIVELRGDKYEVLFQNKISVKLGEGGINKGFIAPTPFARGIDAMKTHKKTIEDYGVNGVFAFATSAIRDAENGAEFVKNIKEICGIEIQVISGDKEAEYIYHGVRSGVKMTNSTSLIIDIGGGSTEFIIANNQEIFWKKSFPLGASRLLQKTQPSEPITKQETEKLVHYLNLELQPLVLAAKEHCITEIIGSSGSFDSLSEMIDLNYYQRELFKNGTEYVYDMQDFEKIYTKIIASTKEERLKMKGLIPMRADMIVVSCILLKTVLDLLNISHMRSSTYSLKEGVLTDLFEK